MTTMSDSGSPSFAGQPPFSGPRMLRRSGTDRVISGVSGGLGSYFGVDPVIFRVLFAVLTFFGGVGLLAYGIAWVLIPEPDVDRSLLDKALNWLRVRRVPPWLVILGGAMVVWLGWFSWWAPRTLPAIVLLAVVALLLTRRLRNRPLDPPPAAGWTPATGPNPPEAGPMPTGPMPAGPWQPTAAHPGWMPPPAGPVEAAVASAEAGPDTPAGTPADADSQPTGLLWPTAAENADGESTEHTAVLPAGAVSPADATRHTSVLPAGPPGDGGWQSDDAWQPPPVVTPADRPGQGQGTAPLIAPLNDTRRTMKAWLAEAGEAHRVRVQRRRPIKVAVLLALIAGWGLVALLDAFGRVPFPAYLWVGLAILATGLLVSIVSRRMTLSLLVPMAFLGVIAVGLGGTPASLSDGSGRIGWQPTSQADLGTYRQFAGQSTLDLTQLATLTSPASVRITQAAGEVVLKLPATLNATVISDVHMGDIQNGQSTAAGQFQAGLNVHLQTNPPAGATGQPLTIHVTLTTGHVEIDRAS